MLILSRWACATSRPCNVKSGKPNLRAARIPVAHAAFASHAAQNCKTNPEGRSGCAAPHLAGLSLGRDSTIRRAGWQPQLARLVRNGGYEPTTANKGANGAHRVGRRTRGDAAAVRGRGRCAGHLGRGDKAAQSHALLCNQRVTDGSGRLSLRGQTGRRGSLRCRAGERENVDPQGFLSPRYGSTREKRRNPRILCQIKALVIWT